MVSLVKEKHSESAHDGPHFGVVGAVGVRSDGECPFVFRPGLGELANGVEEMSQVVERPAHLRMVCPESRLADLQAALEQGLRGPELLEANEENRQVVEALGHIQVIGTEGRFAEGQCPFVHRPGYLEATLQSVKRPQVRQATGDELWVRVGIVGSDLQTPLHHLARAFEVAPLPVQEPEIVEAGGDIGVVGTEHRLTYGEAALVMGLRFRELPLPPQHNRQILQTAGDIQVVGCQYLPPDLEAPTRQGLGLDVGELACQLPHPPIQGDHFVQQRRIRLGRRVDRSCEEQEPTQDDH